jgi:hypothetical protein
LPDRLDEIGTDAAEGFEPLVPDDHRGRRLQVWFDRPAWTLSSHALEASEGVMESCEENTPLPLLRSAFPPAGSTNMCRAGPHACLLIYVDSTLGPRDGPTTT